MKQKIKKWAYVLFFISVSVYIFSLTAWGRWCGDKYQQGVDFIASTANFHLEQVVVQGHIRTQKEDVNLALNLVQGMPIFDIDLNEKKGAISSLPWIKKVVIERKLPTQLVVHIVEKKPIAIWQNQGKYYPLDEEGSVILDDKTTLFNLILVVGNDAPVHTLDLLKALNQYPDIINITKSAVRVGNRRWNLYLNDAEKGILIELPEDEIGAALKRLQQFNTKGKILQRDIKVIDLKVPNRLIVRMPDEKGGK